MDLSHLPICSSSGHAAHTWLFIGGAAGCFLHCAATGAALFTGCCGMHRLASGWVTYLTRYSLPAMFGFASLSLLTYSGVLI